MKPKKSKSKTKKTVEQENKKPPVIQTPQPEAKKSITEEDEKNMLLGQIHIESKETDQKNLEEPKEVTIQPTPKKKIEVKPRESYLKDKISKMECSEKLLSSIKKGLGEQMKTIKTDIKENNILITEVPKNLKQLILRKADTDATLTPGEDYEMKKRHKAIKELKNEQNKLKQKLIKLKENGNLLENQSFLNISIPQKYPNFEKSIKEFQIKDNKSKINDLINKISLIDEKISQLILADNQSTRKDKLKSFIENFERDKEIAEVRARKYLKESKERSQRMANDINQLIEKRKKEIDNRSKEAELQKEELIKKFKEQEKAIEFKRSKKIEKKAILCKPYIFEIPEKKANSYLFSQKYKDYQKKEEKIIKKGVNKRKEIMKSVRYEEIKEFADKFDEKKENNNLKSEENKKKLIEEWKERRNSLPQQNPTIENYESENKLEEESRKEKIEALIKNKKNYSTLIKEEKQPTINQKLKKQRINRIFELENPKLVKSKINLSSQKKKRIILKKRDPNKPSKFKWQLKLDEDQNNKLNNSVILQNSFIKKPKSIRLSVSFDNSKKKRTIPSKKIDYLKVFVAEREEKEKANSGKENINNIKWQKAINNKSGSVIENVNLLKQKAENLHREAEMKQKILKLNGGIENNPDLGKKVSNLLIDSIEAKLTVLNEIGKNKY